MGKATSFGILMVISVSLLKVASAKTCPKAIIQTYSVYTMNPLTQKLTPAVRSKQSITFGCCDGYREIGRVKSHLDCEPVCDPPCGHGFCYTPNRCACDSGYKQTKFGNCETEKTTNAQPQSTVVFDKPMIHTTPAFKSNLLPTTSYESPLEPKPIIPTTHSSYSEKLPSLKLLKTTTQKPNVKTTTTPGDRHPTTTQTCGRCEQGTCISGICSCPVGYNLTQEGICKYKVVNKCDCPEGHACETGSLLCKPLCNGKIYGCIRGTCVAYNQCRCENGTVLHKDELFHCTNEKILQQKPINWSLYSWLLLIPAALLVICFYIIISRCRTARKNRLEALDDSFSEVRYYNPNSDYSLTGRQQPPSNKVVNTIEESGCRKDSLHRNARVVIINA